MVPLFGGCALFDPANLYKPGDDSGIKPATPEPVTSAPAFRLPGATPESPGAGPVWVAQTATVGSIAHLQGANRMRVRGYGLVVGIEGRGSGKCPKSVFEYLEKELRRMPPGEMGELAGIPAGELLRRTDTAAVVVEGEIPVAAVKGSRFDVFVRTVDRDVKSISGGRLLRCDLKMTLSAETAAEGRVLARAAGRVFTNPFAKGGDATGDGEAGRGRILGGGYTSEDRRIQVILSTPSYATVKAVTQIINDRFGSSPKAADGRSAGNIWLTVPKAFHGRETRFLELVMHLSTIESAEMREMRAKALCDDLARSDAPCEETALCLEALGKPAIPVVRKLYASRQRATSFFAARVGARLGDDLAIDALRRHADEREGLYRQAAIRELGETPAYRSTTAASEILRRLVADDDPRTRIPAYEALLRQHDAVVSSYAVGRDNFVLDIVACDGPGFIYGRRTQERRIAVMGRGVRCRAPLLYSYPDRPVTVSARTDDDRIALVRKLGGGQLVWDPIHVSFDVVDLIRTLGKDSTRRDDGRPEGLAIDYAVVLDVLAALCRDKGILADFRIEQPSVTDLLGPAEPAVRPESDEL